MGIVFGVTGTQEPPFTVISNTPNYQVRVYSPYLIAEVPQIVGQENSSFTILAKYIGVFGTPENLAKEALAMTSPVITVAQKDCDDKPSAKREGHDVIRFTVHLYEIRAAASAY
jgi:hypothetical protein